MLQIANYLNKHTNNLTNIINKVSSCYAYVKEKYDDFNINANYYNEQSKKLKYSRVNKSDADLIANWVNINIGKHKPRLTTSFYYLFRTLFLIYCVSVITKDLLNYISMRYLLYPYAALQGINFTSLIILGLECNNNAFSENHSINNLLGYILHSFALIPYFSFKYMLSNHQKFINNIKYDTINNPSFNPIDKYGVYISEFIHFNVISGNNLVLLMSSFIINAFSLFTYLLTHTSGMKKNIKDDYTVNYNSHQPFHNNLYLATSPIVEGLQTDSLSTFGCILSLLLTTSMFSVGEVWFWYWLPLLFSHSIFMTITNLQHNHINVPKFDNEQDAMVCRLATINYKWNYLFDNLLHHYASAHTIKHLMPQIPHYYLPELVEQFKQSWSSYYLIEETPFIYALLNNTKECAYICETKDNIYYKNWSKVTKSESVTNTPPIDNNNVEDEFQDAINE